MSVSDIVAIKRDGKVSCHYCDSFGFAEVPGFLPDNPLKNAEMAVEDDYGMIDGILNNGQRQPPQRELPEKRKSVVEQLKSQPKPEHKKDSAQKRARKGRSDMNALTFEETNLLCIYNPGTRQGPSRP